MGGDTGSLMTKSELRRIPHQISREATMKSYILLDRSGSMSSRWEETISAVNNYATTLAKEAPDASLTVATFDTPAAGIAFEVIRSDQKCSDWKAIGVIEASPRGYTPLFDAIARLMGLAEAAAPDQGAIVVVTDGAENASRETTREGAKAAFDRARAKGWQVVFLGADFDAFGEASSVGTMPAQTLNATKGNLGATMGIMAASTARYMATGATMDWSQSDRDIAAGKAKPAA